MKYITYMFQGIPDFIIFPETRDHLVMADKLNIRDEIIGAGWAHFYPDRLNCYGGSVSLKVKMNTEDTSIIQRYFKRDE